MKFIIQILFLARAYIAVRPCDKISHSLSRAHSLCFSLYLALGATLILNHLLLLRRWRAPTVSQLGAWLAAPYLGIFVGRHARTHYSKARKRSRHHPGALRT